MYQWLSVHGNAGCVQDAELTASTQTSGGWHVSPNRFGEAHVIHFPVPSFTKDEWKVDFVQFNFFLKGYLNLRRIELFDGRIQFWVKDVDIFSHQGRQFDDEFDLGSKWSIYAGLGVSLVLHSSHEGPGICIFNSVGARFTK